MTLVIRNQSGLITVDFIFSMVLILGLSGLLFVLSFTLSMASITQYVTFSAARNYFAAHLTEEAQILRGQSKYQELSQNPVLKPLFTNGWFKIDGQATIGDHTQVVPEYQQAAQGVNKFWGAGVNFVASVLDFNIPFFGSTAPDGDGSGSGFKTYIGSYLGREPSTQECLAFAAQRWSAIRNLKSSSGTANYGMASDGGRFYIQADDGC